MVLTTAQIAAWLGAYFWPFVRIGSMLLVAPVFGTQMVPARVRILVALALTWLVVPLAPAPPAIDPLSPGAVPVALSQVMVGVAMGFVLQLTFAALVFGGQMLAMGMGLGFASMVDPQNGIQVPVVSQYYLVLATLIFLALDGHLLLIGVLADSFRTLPVGDGGLTSEGMWSLVAWGSHLFAGGVLIALPAVTATLVTNLAFGVITRAAPQLNIFAVGFPVTLLVGFMAMLATIAYLAPQLSSLLREAYGLLRLLALGNP